MSSSLLAVLTAAGAVFGKVLLNLLASLLTETVMKRLIVFGLKKVVDKTQSDADNQILAICLEAWGEPAAKPEEK